MRIGRIDRTYNLGDVSDRNTLDTGAVLTIKTAVERSGEVERCGTGNVCIC